MMTLRTQRKIADEIKACFDGIDLTKHSFAMGREILQSVDGETKFYSATEIDKAIARINALMSTLRALT